MGRVLRFLRAKLRRPTPVGSPATTATRFGWLDRHPGQTLRHAFRWDRTAGG